MMSDNLAGVLIFLIGAVLVGYILREVRRG